MVGRIAQEPFDTTSSQRATLRDLGGMEDVDAGLAAIVPRYNLAPTQAASVVYRGDSGLHVERMGWRLWPKHEKSPNFKYSTFNARIENVHSLWSFRNAFAERRCVVPLRGFYEWETSADGTKQPHFFHAPDAAPLWAAGIWEGPRYRDMVPIRTPTFAIVTRPAVEPVLALHARMPVLLDLDQLSAWMDGPPEMARSVALAPPRPSLAVHAVSRAVNGTAVDSPDLIEPAGGHP